MSAILVFVSHLDSFLCEEIRFVIGRIGVVLFFLLSGFLSVHARKKRSTKQYLINRFLRIFPMFWLLLFLFVIEEYFIGEKVISVGRLIGNMLLVGSFCDGGLIIGASWMLPIQVSFFVIIAVLKTDFFNKKYHFGVNIGRTTVFLLVILMLACTVSVIRYVSNKSLPVAYCLLIAVGILGIEIFYNKKVCNESILVFEIGLLISTGFSYPKMWIYYFIAYNLGILFFLKAMRVTKKNEFLYHLGQVGFIFFLGAKIPINFIKSFGSLDYSFPSNIVMWLIEFMTALALSMVLHYSVERKIWNVLKVY